MQVQVEQPAAVQATEVEVAQAAVITEEEVLVAVATKEQAVVPMSVESVAEEERR